MARRAKKTGVAILGFFILIAGIIMIPYPGPGWLVVFAGLGILSTEFEWAKRLLNFAKSKYDAWEKWVMSQNDYVKAALGFMTFAVVTITLWLLNAYGFINGFLGLGWDWMNSPLPIFK